MPPRTRRWVRLHTPQFPVELIEEIIFYLSDDSDSLTKCALVSKVFRAASHRHLFATFTLHIDQYRGFSLVLSEIAEHAHLAVFITHLTISGPGPYARRDTRKIPEGIDMGESRPPACILSTRILPDSLWQSLPKLRYLTLRFVWIVLDSELERLHITSLDSPKAIAAANTSVLPDKRILESLTLDQVAISQPVGATFVDVISRIKDRRLTLQNMRHELRYTDGLRSLKIIVRTRFDPSLVTMRSFLRLAYPTLVRLHVVIPLQWNSRGEYDRWDTEAAQTFDLPAFTRLHDVVVELRLHKPPRMTFDWSPLTSVIQHLPTKTVINLRIIFVTGEVGYAEQYIQQIPGAVRSSLNSTFQRLLPTLKHCDLVLHAPLPECGHSYNPLESLRVHVPSLQDKGILHIGQILRPNQRG
ncbi:hypothetical protein K474DRAFT_605176 [Panus rudis PR-1116 ss-1]|nr:hypothetical protein K474DRAFT_605176 [Panus rudis PR-1116 ss-1]